MCEALREFTSEEPSAARFFFLEGLSGGSGAFQARQSVLLALGGLTRGSDRRHEGIVVTLLGGLFRLLAMRLREPGSGLTAAEGTDLIAWLKTYEGVWSEGCGTEHASAAITTLTSVHPIVAVGPSGGLEGVSRPVPASTSDRRRQAMAAVTRISYESSYRQVTVADIAAGAALSRRSFYELFDGKADVAGQATQRYFQTVMTMTASAYFAAPDWLDRIWAGGAALLGCLASRPSESHLAFVEIHAIEGPVLDLAYSRLPQFFATFLEEAYRFSEQAEGLPRICSDALAATLFDAAFRELHENRTALRLAERLPEFAFIALAPFLGASAAIDFVSEKISAADAA